MAALVEHAMLLESARGPLPNVAEVVAGERVRGSWWAGRALSLQDALAQLPDCLRS
jgi:hypothetical protein